MTMRRTPYAKIRYPWTSDTVSVADVESMGADIDAQLVTTARMANDFSKFASVTVQRTAAQSLTKGTLTAISFDTVKLNNGSDSPLANGNWWAAGSPTRLTAPVACLVLATGYGGVNFTAAPGTNSTVEVVVGLNGGGNVQGTKFPPISTLAQQWWASCLTMWKLNAGDFLEMKMLWTGTPAGPLNTDTALPPLFSLAMVALPSVP